jgi:hypothetical protein
MKKNFITIIFFVTLTFLLIGAVSAANVNNLPAQTTVKVADNSNSIQSPQTHIISKTNANIVSSTTVQRLIDSGSNKFYWGQRGGIFSYTWKTYLTGTGSILVYMHYKTTTNSWFSRYSITKFSKYKLKVVETSPEIKLYTGHPSETSYASSTMSPAQYYWKKFRFQIKTGGYFSV